ncbi:Serine/threonine-protein kinase [Drechslerella dactyloides]|uniref:Serine/threonine-protein kinase n=1 Tax=Drechslerella dactyloides TaxID=74499 RepID=A0AAD6J1X0_DREDA|nr:Serine/threonine-protein kinase [Drechslerella dactyloides]
MASHMQNLKNFIRHGKQARDPGPAPATTASTHAHAHAVHDPPSDHHHHHKHHGEKAGEHSAAASGAQANLAAQAENQASHKQSPKQHIAEESEDRDTAVARIVAEERESRGKLPRYPGLERWILIEKMGDGAFSNVYRAKDSLGELGEVAIKVVRKYELSSSQRANILKEVQIMRQLNHPNIVKLISFSESKSYYYIILELCQGGELFHQIVRLTYFSEDLSRHVIVQVAEALRYLHEEKGVVHRDIKPENLLFDPIPFVPTKHPKPKNPNDEDKVDEGEFIPGVGAGGIGRIKIADFGLSKVVWDSVTMTPCGTVGYTAPEIVKDERYSKSVDMWALGCVLYTLLCGFPPFYDESISVLTEKVARGQYTFLSPWWDDISKSAQDLVSHLLTVDPDSRYTIEQFMAHPWIRNTDEETQPAADAPPLATPAASRSGYYRDGSPMLLDDFTPSGERKRMDFRSPGNLALREVFDVGYAVHRMEEETKQRKKHKANFTNLAANMTLNEEDEEYDEQVGAVMAPIDEMEGMERDMRRTSISNATAQKRAPPAKAQQQQQPQPQKVERGRKKAGFELSLDNATLLGRRKRNVDGGGVVSAQA